MDKLNLMPQVAQPINRIATGQLPSELAELSEEVFCSSHQSTSVLPSGYFSFDGSWVEFNCSYDGDDAE